MRLYPILLRHVYNKHTLRKCKETTLAPMQNISKIFGKYLLITNTVTSGILMAMGDFIQQNIEHAASQNPKKVDGLVDWKRSGDMFVVGIAQGPPQHYFYEYLDRFLPRRNLRTVLKKILLDQLICSPISIGILFGTLGYLESQTIRSTVEEFRRKFFTIYIVDWMVWPPTQYINFKYLPPKYRVLYVNAITMLYDVFLSFMKYNDTEPEEQASD